MIYQPWVKTMCFQMMKKTIFRPLNADDAPEITELESLCTECEEQGNTCILLTKVPFFRDACHSDVIFSALPYLMKKKE